MRNTMDNYNELIRQLKGWRTDWDGSEMKRGEPPRDGIHCDVLYDAADAIEALQARVSELEARVNEIVNIQGNRIDDVRKLCDVLGVEPDPTSSPAYNFERCLLRAERLRNAS